MTTTPETPPVLPGVTEVERLRLIWEWIREPDWAETFTQHDLLKWIDQRPCHHVSALQAAAQVRAEQGRDERDDLRARLAAAETRAVKVVEMLRKVEWACADDGDECRHEACCPACGWQKREGRHAPDCALAALLAPDADPAIDAARDEGGRDNG